MTTGPRTERFGGMWAVVDAAERRVGPLHGSPLAAEHAWERRERRRARQSRPCLRCGARFMSDGPHNRMCDRCRTVALPPQMLAGSR